MSVSEGRGISEGQVECRFPRDRSNVGVVLPSFSSGSGHDPGVSFRRGQFVPQGTGSPGDRSNREGCFRRTNRIDAIEAIETLILDLPLRLSPQFYSFPMLAKGRVSEEEQAAVCPKGSPAQAILKRKFECRCAVRERRA
jgi:hypothetical protein